MYYLLSFGGAFFAIPYVALSVGAIPSIAIGAGAYLASELIFHDKEKVETASGEKTINEILEEAKLTNQEILKMTSKIEKAEVIENIKEINKSIDKIITTIEKDHKKCRKMNKFFDYYLPVTLKIIKKYDEIENQNLSSQEGKDFMKSSEDMFVKINQSFKKQLSKLYQSDMIDTDAEMKIFNDMLNVEGYTDEDDFEDINRKEG